METNASLPVLLNPNRRRAITLGGFPNNELNINYQEQADVVGGRNTFASESGSLVIFWRMADRRWLITDDCGLEAVKAGKTFDIKARSPQNTGIADASIRGWEIFDGSSWIPAANSGVSHCADMKGKRKRADADESVESNATNIEDGTDPLSPFACILILLSTVIPNGLIVFCFSAIGFGIKIYNYAASTSYFIGNGAVMLAVLFLCILYVLDYSKMTRCAQAVLAVMQAGLVIGASVMKSRSYAWTPVISCMVTIPFFLGYMRCTMCRNTRRKDFYMALSTATSLSAAALFALLFVWAASTDRLWNTATKEWLALSLRDLYQHIYPARGLDYMTHCHPTADLASQNIGKSEREAITSACASAATVWWMIYVCPLVLSVSNLAVAIFCLAQFWLGMQSVLRVIQTVVVGLACLCMCLYFVNLVTASSLQISSFLMALYGVAMCSLIVWAHLEIGFDRLQDYAKQSFVAGLLVKAGNSHIGRALAVMSVGIFIPVFFLLSMMNQCTRRIRGTSISKDKYTDHGRKMADMLATWNWCAILTRVCILAELFFVCNVGFTKVTYIFLSWLDSEIQDWNLWAINALITAAGFVMFLLPPVPGASVYLFAGLVIGQAGEASIGIPLSILVGTITCTITKLFGCTGQYMIGYFLGKSVKVQQMIAVDSVGTRGIEQILKTQGLNVGKVAVLVGGPDWPVSVACGILKVNIPQMLLGTLPIFVCALPITAAGAFMTKSSNTDRGNMYSLLVPIAMALSLLVNGAFSLTAIQRILRVIERDQEELVKPREEHRAVEELTQQEQAWQECYNRISAWETLSNLRRFVILTAAILHITCPAIFVLLATSCFRRFSLGSSRIEDPFEQHGLEGNPLNIVLPMGWCALALFGLAVTLHLAHIFDMKFATNRAFAERHREMPLERRHI
eukprot:TRINITY_DN18565_c0_g1_i1.p1 TRINITY_DN18565_c0_g1~~TRINITY_DN18565_c0_g1_i1.p1  ORF type:complete len:913 (-),score=140.00 TRINITY_DN18565_c0_g1_i1:116-2854(-)